MSTILESIVASTRADVDRRRATVPLAALQTAAAERDAIRPFAAALTARPGVALIAEHKRRSPSGGEIGSGAPIEGVVAAYERGGAAALSVLTEGPNFGGALEDLAAARRASSLPVLRKDFIVEPYQLQESLAAGADAILLIVAALERGELERLHDGALELGLDVLVEVHDRAELDAAVAIGARLIGVNNRDLHDFSVDVARTHALLDAAPGDAVLVSESGLHSREQVEALGAAGVSAVLIGEALMRAGDPEAAVRALTGSP